MARLSGMILCFFSLVLFFIAIIMANLEAAVMAVEKVKVGVLIGNSPVEESCISMAFNDFYQTHPQYRTRLELTSRYPNDSVITAASAAMDLMENEEVHAIIGPEHSSQAKFIIDLGSKIQVPIISFSATSPSLSPTQHNSYFIRTADDDRSQLRAIASIIQFYGWTQVVLIYEDTDYGNGLFPHISDVFQEHDIQVPYRSEIPPSLGDEDILEELNKVMNNTRARVFLVHMTAPLGSRVFTIANEAGMLSQDTAWIVTDGLSSLLDPVNSQGIDAMQGVLGVRPYIPVSPQLKSFQERWKSNQLGQFSKDWNLFGLWAYDTVTALATVAENVWNSSESHYFNKKPNNKTSTMDYSSIGVSRIGPKILETMRDIKIDGLSGDFHLINGQLREQTVFEVFNVVGNQERVIGYWTLTNGVSRRLVFDRRDDDLGLKPPIWPGDTVKNPRGWIATVGGKKLRIGVPIKGSFNELIKVEPIGNTNSGNYSFSGFSCDVFIAVLKQLPYDIPLELIPYGIQSKPNGSYDDMIFQIKLKKFDAVIGDTSITPSRLDYVGFTVPYTDAGVSMLVKAKEVDQRTSMWVFLSPLRWEMWFTTAMAFLMIGFIVWMFERSHNEDFSGSPGHQVVVSLWFSFSTLVFAHKERVLNNWTRLVLVVWLFVVLIITQTYTASLASILTVKKLQPRTLEVAELVRTRQYVGFQRGSYVKNLLLRLDFEESRLIGLGSPEEYNDELSKGSVAAVFDEIPYLKVVVGKYCNTYMIVGPVYQTDGFAFAFPLGSPLVPDFSRAIVNLKMEGKLSEIGRKYFGNGSCEAARLSFLEGSVLNVYNFGGLFIIIGVVSLVAILGEFFSTCSQIRVGFSSLRAASVTCLNQVADRLYAWSRWRKARTGNHVVALASSSSST